MWQNRRFVPKRRLGFGYQSEVWLAEDLKTNSDVVIKATNCSNIENIKILAYLRDERLCLETLKREIEKPEFGCGLRFDRSYLRVPIIIHVFHEPANKKLGSRKKIMDETIFFVLKFVPGAPLHYHIRKMHGLPETQVKFHAAELVAILGALHERGIIYRDLKASNVIVQPNGRITLIDFGFAKFIGSRGRTRSVCGTLHAMSPEMLIQNQIQSVEAESMDCKTATFNTTMPTQTRKKSLGHHSASTPNITINKRYPESYGMEVDWWALGVLIYEMIFFQPPFKYHNEFSDREATVRSILEASASDLEIPNTVETSNELKDLIKALLHPEAEKRLGHKRDALEIQESPWFNGFNWLQLKDPNAKGPEVYQFPEDQY